MKRSADKWHIWLNDYVAFFGYRWIALLIAGLSFMIPGRPAEDLPRDSGMLLLLLVLTAVLTTIAAGYTRLARQRPLILLFDLAASAAIVWMGGRTFLPFLPYALGCLVLPALLFGARGALVAGLLFVAIDQASLIVIAPQAQGAALIPTLLARALAPLVFGFCWVAVSHLFQSQPAAAAPDSPALLGARPEVRAGGAAAPANPRLMLPNPIGRDLGALPPTIGMPLSPIARTAGSPSAPQAVDDHGLELDLPAALDQLVTATNRQSDLALRAVVSGAQRLNLSQHTVLLRTAQEAIQNVIHHARAHTVLITLTFERRAVTLAIQDDGVGLLDGTYERPGLHALRALRYRLAELDGHLDVFESDSGGVTVRATLPLDPV